MNKNAFTLAEVLITIGVIGVVSAVTLPVLIKNYNNKVVAERLKKTYNTISNGIKLSEIDNGSMKDWPTGEDMNVYEYFNTYFKPYFNGVKLCSNTAACGYKNFDGRKWTNRDWGVVTNNTRLLFQLIDGTVVFYPRDSAGVYVNYFYVDINGNQKPNTYEKDVYIFRRGTEKGIEPIGKARTIMQNGWVIKD